MTWLPTGFVHPAGLHLRSGHHLRPIREADVDLDYPAVMGSRLRLWRMYGEAWGWPPSTMTLDRDRSDLARHAQEMLEGLSFNYAIFDEHESELLGCVYIDPPARPDEGDAVVSWWIVDHAVGSRLEVALDETVPLWLADDWPFSDIRYGVYPAGP